MGSSSCTLIHPQLQSVMERAGWVGLGSDTFGTCSRERAQLTTGWKIARLS